MNPQDLVNYRIALIYESCIALFALFMVIRIGSKYKQQKSKVKKYVFYFFLMLWCAVVLSAFSRYLRLSGLWLLPSGEYLELISISVASIAIANIFLLGFDLEVFQGGINSGRNKLYLIIYSIIGFLSAFYIIWSGIFVVDLNLIIWGLIIVISIPIYVIMIKSSMQLARKVDDKLTKRSTQLIGLSALAILMYFVCGALDVVMGGNFTFFYYAGWICAIITIISFDIGVNRPEWFKKRMLKKK